MSDFTAKIAEAGAVDAGYRVAKSLCRDAKHAVTLESMNAWIAQISSHVWLEDDAYADPKAFLDGFFKELRNQLNDLESAVQGKPRAP